MQVAACLYRRQSATDVIFLIVKEGMRSLKFIFTAILSLTVLSCVGQKDEVMEGDLQFIADKTILSVDNGEQATFSVLCNGLDVTSESTIFDITGGAAVELPSPVFIPEDRGIYKFQAYYMDVAAPQLQIEAVKSEEKPTGEFLRKYMIMKFTATWCVKCPNMAEAIKSVKSSIPGRIIDISVHYIDDFQVEDGKKYLEYFNVSAIPVAVVNLDKRTQTSIASSTLLTNSINKVVVENLPVCGIKLSSIKENGMVVVDVETTITGDGKYKIAVALLEDGIIKAQTGGGAEYVHNGVLRDMLQQSVLGDGLGECKSGDVISQRYQFSADNLKSDGKYRLAAFLLKECGSNNFIVNNITECQLYGSTDYIYDSNE